MTDKEVKVHFTKLLMQCAIDHPIKFADLLQLQQLQTPKKTEAKCLLMCAYKKLNTMNEKGLFDLEENYKNAELVANGDQDRLINGKKLVDTCIKGINKHLRPYLSVILNAMCFSTFIFLYLCIVVKETTQTTHGTGHYNSMDHHTR
uniref:Putative odorant binding protein 27 n=1 Tax=Conopomorpha sinensis TaxID=940481 RepID=A0A649ZUD6_9NEOP|nr:putative odorant binding protein 27 [Conopomorpha sinensis]